MEPFFCLKGRCFGFLKTKKEKLSGKPQSKRRKIQFSFALKTKKKKEEKEELMWAYLQLSLGKYSVLLPVLSISIRGKRKTGLQRIAFILLHTHDPFSFSLFLSLTHADTFAFNDCLFSCPSQWVMLWAFWLRDAKATNATNVTLDSCLVQMLFLCVCLLLWRLPVTFFLFSLPVYSWTCPSH